MKEAFGGKLCWELDNKEHYKWLMIYNDSIMVARGDKSIITHNYSPQMGIDCADVTTEFCEKHKLNSSNGVIVKYVKRQSAAQIAGLKKDDVILAIDGVDIHSNRDFYDISRRLEIGDWMRLKVWRKKKIINLTLRTTW